MERIAGYRLVAPLGDGGMGRVHLARTASGRLVAVKTVHEHLAAEPAFRERFRRELVAARSVTGPFTAAVLDADPDAVRPWLATVFCPGPGLGTAVDAHGPLRSGELATLGAALAEALAAIHAAGLVHRDLTPSNVVVTRGGPMVIDFGIAKAAAERTLTGDGEIIGSPGFIAPELLTATVAPTPAADVFSLGALLSRAATGRPPYGTGRPHQILYRSLHDGPDLDGVPDPEWREFLGRLLARDPAERPTVTGVLDWCAARAPAVPWWEGAVVTRLIARREEEVAALAAGTAPAVRRSPARPDPPTSEHRQPSSRRRLLRWGGALLVGGSAVGGVVAMSARPFGGTRELTQAEVAVGPQPRTLWTRRVGGAALLRHGTGLCLHEPTRITRLDARTGAVRWTYDDDGITGLAAAGGLLFVLRSAPVIHHEVIALDATTGKPRWSGGIGRPLLSVGLMGRQERPLGASTVSRPAGEGASAVLSVRDGLLCLVTHAPRTTLWEERSARGQRWHAYGYDARTGRALWFHEGTSAGVVGVHQAGGRIAVAASQSPERASGQPPPRPLFVLRARDGTLEREIPDGGARPEVHPGSTGVGHYAEGRLTSAVELATGRVLWRRALEEEARITPTATHGVVLVSTPEEFRALDARTGRTRWSRTDVAGLMANRPPLVSGSQVHLSGPDPKSREPAPHADAWGVYTLDVRTGDMAWRTPLDTMRDITAVAGTGLLHVSSHGTLYTFGLPDPA